MNRGRTCYIALTCGIITLALLLVSVYQPMQFTFETHPYAREALLSGNAYHFTAADIGLEPETLAKVQENYEDFLQRNKMLKYESESSDESESTDVIHLNLADLRSHGHIHHDPKEHDDILGGPDDGNDGEIPCDEQEELGHVDASHGTGANSRRRCKTRGNHVDRNENITQLHPHVRASEVILNANENDQPNATTTRDEDGSASDDESSESSDNDGDGSEEDRVQLQRRLAAAPWMQVVSLGLFNSRICQVMKQEPEVERCVSVGTQEGISVMSKEVAYMDTDINMAMWNNLRVESLFSVVACALGLLFLLASLRPCCEQPRLPLYLGSLAFFASGILILMPLVRFLLVRDDLIHELERDFNVTTKVLTSWSLVISGCAMPFALLAGCSMIATKWYKTSKKWYSTLKQKPSDVENRRKPDGLLMRQFEPHPTDDIPRHKFNANHEGHKPVFVKK